MTHFFKAISNFVKNIHTKAVGDAKIWATKMINTFNAGLWELAQRIKTDCDYLLAHGKYSEDCMLPDPVDFQRLETQDTYSPDKVHSHTLKLMKGNWLCLAKQGLWDSIARFLDALLSTAKHMDEIHPIFKVSYAESLKSFIEAGNKLMNMPNGLKEDHFSIGV